MLVVYNTAVLEMHVAHFMHIILVLIHAVVVEYNVKLVRIHAVDPLFTIRIPKFVALVTCTTQDVLLREEQLVVERNFTSEDEEAHVVMEFRIIPFVVFVAILSFISRLVMRRVQQNDSFIHNISIIIIKILRYELAKINITQFTLSSIIPHYAGWRLNSSLAYYIFA